jgi:uncharacterized integral membrane protein
MIIAIIIGVLLFALIVILIAHDRAQYQRDYRSARASAAMCKFINDNLK